ncbi:MAG TPA: acetylxylan esterase [Gemmataceae bacterium]|jgi:hypothetical protein|nr:acetylxylan esterase [Gemmataceae bacterium]
MRTACSLLVFASLNFFSTAPAQEKSPVLAWLGHSIVGTDDTRVELLDYIERKVPRMPEVKTAAEWQKADRDYRQRVLDEVIFRGQAISWRDAKVGVEWSETISGGEGYRIRKLRYEALPGMWIPALLYEPERLAGKVPVSLAVNGHDGKGKAAGYKQIRCINMAKRGMIVLNVEWLGMGQLRGPGWRHGCMNQLDLCGSSGIAPFYLAMTRGLDILLAHDHADPDRVAVSGLSGGGWQTIFVSALDTRVKLANPVAGYSSFRTRIQHWKDLGDSEQTPCDLATVVDYAHLTAMLAPRSSLLTYNDKDDCCFESGYALPPLLDAARPIFRLLEKEKALRSHINSDPGTHNFEKDNRQALYKMLGDFFFADDAKFSAEEIPCPNEVKTIEELMVSLPEKNVDFNVLAQGLAKQLPRNRELPTDKATAEKWQKSRREKLAAIVRPFNLNAQAVRTRSEEKNVSKATFWRLKLNDRWTLPVVELVRGEPKSTIILLADAGRPALVDLAEKHLAAGHRVLAVDLFYFGECKIKQHDWLFAILLAAVGDRPLGLQAGQLQAVARWAEKEFLHPAKIVAVGPRLSAAALVAAALEPKAIAGVELHESMASLKEIIEQNKTVEQMPELFCFGLLEHFDLREIMALVAPRPVVIAKPSERQKREFEDLAAVYEALGNVFDPVK